MSQSHELHQIARNFEQRRHINIAMGGQIYVRCRDYVLQIDIVWGCFTFGCIYKLLPILLYDPGGRFCPICELVCIFGVFSGQLGEIEIVYRLDVQFGDKVRIKRLFTSLCQISHHFFGKEEHLFRVANNWFIFDVLATCILNLSPLSELDYLLEFFESKFGHFLLNTCHNGHIVRLENID